MMDWEGTVDAFFRGYFDTNEDVQETDTHYRCSDGKPDFEYRLVYRIKVPRKNGYNFTLQMWDRDFFKSNDMVGQVQINLKDIIEDCALVKKPLGLNKSYYNDVMKKNDPNLNLEFDPEDDNKFWLKIINKNKETGKIETNGRVRV